MHSQRPQTAAIRVSARNQTSAAAAQTGRRRRRSVIYRRSGRKTVRRALHDSHRADRKQRLSDYDDVPVFRTHDASGTPGTHVKLALIGDPVSHSRSPRLHERFLEEAGIEGSYVAIRVPKGNALD